MGSIFSKSENHCVDIKAQCIDVSFVECTDTVLYKIFFDDGTHLLITTKDTFKDVDASPEKVTELIKIKVLYKYIKKVKWYRYEKNGEDRLDLIIIPYTFLYSLREIHIGTKIKIPFNPWSEQISVQSNYK